MQMFTGYTLIWLGIIMIVTQVLVWLGVVKLPPNPTPPTKVGGWDFLIELLKQQLWVPAIAIILIAVGMRMLGLI